MWVHVPIRHQGPDLSIISVLRRPAFVSLLCNQLSSSPLSFIPHLLLFQLVLFAETRIAQIRGSPVSIFLSLFHRGCRRQPFIPRVIDRCKLAYDVPFNNKLVKREPRDRLQSRQYHHFSSHHDPTPHMTFYHHD